MLLRTLGGMGIDGVAFARPKPLLLLTYLAVEGPRPRRHLAELFWPDAADPMRSLSVALTRLRKGAPGSVAADREHAASEVRCDVHAFLAHVDRSERSAALDLYRGPFLDGLHLPSWSTELEEWLYAQREHLADTALRALLDEAETQAATGRFGAGADLAERASRLRWAVPQPADLARLHTLMAADGRARADVVRREGEDLGLELTADPEAARRLLAGSRDTGGFEPSSDLPRRDTAFVGRDPERADVAELLARPGPALTTLLGPPGVGKTRLAVEIAREQRALGAFPDGVHFVDLGATRAPEALASAVAASLGADAPSDAAALDGIAALLAGKEALVVLDNAEHLVDGADVFARLVAVGADARFLVTSRVRLGLEAERVYPVTGLPYPADDDVTLEDASAFGAVELFVRRAERTAPGFAATEENLPAILAICRRVEGLPLALELAAAWVRALTPREIAAELDGRLELLATGAQDVPERHRSLLGAFEHAWALVGPRDRELLRRLSVCRGGFRRDAAAEIAGATLTDVAGLIDRSLLRTDGRGRHGAHPLLLELARVKAAEHDAERADARRRHARAYLALLGSWEEDLAGGDQERAMSAVGEDLENVRAAWRHAAATGDREGLWGACRALQIFFIQRGGRWDDAAETFGEAAEALERSDPTAEATTGRLRAAEAWFRYRLGQLDRSERLASVALERLRPLAAADPPDPTLDRALASTLNTLGSIAGARGDRQVAATRFEEVLVLARERGHEPQVAIASHNLGGARSHLGDAAGAEALLREALAINRRRGNRRSMVRNLINLGTSALRAGDPEAAETALSEALELARAIGFDALVPRILSYLGHAAQARGLPGRALELNEQALAALDPQADPGLVAVVHVGLADACSTLGRVDAARSGYLRALEIAWPGKRGDTCAACLAGLAELHLAASEPERAAHLVGLADSVGPAEPETADRLRAVREELREAMPADRLERRLSDAADASIGALLDQAGAPWVGEAP